MHFLTYATYSSVRHSYRQYSAAERSRQNAKYAPSPSHTPTSRTDPAPFSISTYKPTPEQAIAFLESKMFITFRKRKLARYQAQIDHIRAGGRYIAFDYLTPYTPDSALSIYGTPPDPKMR